MASPPLTRPDSQPPSESIREEGELSSSTDDEQQELPSCSNERLSTVSNSVGGAAPDLVVTGGEKTVKPLVSSSNADTSNIQSKPSAHSDVRNSVEKNHFLSRSSVTKWNGKSGPNDNLVIVFSDNESGSDNEGKQKKATKLKDVTSIIQNRWPAPTSHVKVGFSQKANVDKPRFQQKRGQFSRTFSASNTKPYEPKLKEAAKPVSKPRQFIKNPDSLNQKPVKQKVVNQSYKPKLGLSLDVSELQDLRQKIAIRETELKLNTSRKNREMMPGSSQRVDSSNTDIDIQKRERTRALASDYVHLEITEPDKKRIKTDLCGQRKRSAADELVKLGGKGAALSIKNTLGMQNVGSGSNPAGDQSDISGTQNNKLLLNKHTDTVHRVSDRQKEPDSIGNIFDQGYNISSYGPGSDSLQSLLSLEDMHDKELQEAQEHRRHCEIQEKIALKAYHKARSALVEATSRCNALYRQRELSSAQFLSLLFGEANVHMHSRLAMDQVDKTMRANVDGDRTLQLLLELEDSQEKELREAQEYRHKCEIDERNFLKAYRRTQCALIEASDRCSCLYLQRQQSVTCTNIGFYSRCYNHFEISTTDHLNSQSRVDLDVVQSSLYAREAHTDDNLVGCDSNFRSTLSIPATVSNQHMGGNHISPKTCSEPNSSTSEPMPNPDSNADHVLCSSFRNPAVSLDQNEPVLPYDRPCPPESGCEKQRPCPETRNGSDDEDKRRSCPADCDQDTLLQEAKLRSELHARLGQRPFSQKVRCDIQIMQHSVERAAESDIGSEKSEISAGESALSEEEKTQLASHVDQDWDTQLSFGSAAYSADSVLRSTFACIKNLNLLICKSLALQVESIENLSHNSNFKGNDNCSEKTQFTTLEDNQVLLSVKDIFSKQYESYSCNLDADPIWPLCMYELRGKCNDEQCCWQHIKDHDKNTNRPGSLGTACNIRQYFPISIAASRLLKRKMLTAELYGHSGNKRFQANESNRKLSYLQSQGILAEFENSTPGVESSLEMALLILDQEIDKFEGTKKVEVRIIFHLWLIFIRYLVFYVSMISQALSLLSRAIEVDPKSSATWIIYLLIYYSSKRLNVDDMFLYAVENSALSYELWLLYINSRTEVSGRLLAYDKALSVICSESSFSDANADTSSIILDIYLQMLDFLCASGQVEKAMARVQELIHSASTSDESQHLVSRLYSLLTVPDKNILWVCCLYLGVYRRLPEAVVHRFELEKELLGIDWPAVELRDDEIQYAKQLMIEVEEIVDLCIDVVSLDSFSDLKSLQSFAVNHFRCKVALEGFNSGIKLAEKYIQLYPSCLELVLLVARMYSNNFQDLTVSGFEGALSNWPKKVLGIHCIWNQYAAHALENQRFDIASELLQRWYESAWKCQLVEGQMSKDEDSFHQNQHANVDSLNRADKMFGWLTLALYHKLQLQNEHYEAQLAVDRALLIAPPDMYKHCVREHAAFHHMNVQPKEDAFIANAVNLLNSYLADPRASVESCVLSRKFITGINKSRVKQIVTKFLAEISPDCAILNSALEGWYGPSLLPQNCNETKQLVNLVEAVMEIVPTNYPFASSVLRQVSKNLNASDVSASSLLFWAANLLASSIFEAVPVAPESVWVEATDLFGNSTSIQEIAEKFHERAVSTYPFSIRLWKSYLNLVRDTDSSKHVIQRAKERGIQLELL